MFFAFAEIPVPLCRTCMAYHVRETHWDPLKQPIWVFGAVVVLCNGEEHSFYKDLLSRFNFFLGAHHCHGMSSGIVLDMVFNETLLDLYCQGYRACVSITKEGVPRFTFELLDACRPVAFPA